MQLSRPTSLAFPLTLRADSLGHIVLLVDNVLDRDGRAHFHKVEAQSQAVVLPPVGRAVGARLFAVGAEEHVAGLGDKRNSSEEIVKAGTTHQISTELVEALLSAGEVAVHKTGSQE